MYTGNILNKQTLKLENSNYVMQSCLFYCHVYSLSYSMCPIAHNVLACRYSMAVTRTKSVYENVNRRASARHTIKKLGLVKVQFHTTLFLYSG